MANTCNKKKLFCKFAAPCHFALVSNFRSLNFVPLHMIQDLLSSWSSSALAQ